MRGCNHNADSLAIQPLAPQGSKDTNTEHDRVQDVTPSVPISTSGYGIGDRTYKVLNPAVPYWKWTLDGFGCCSESVLMASTGSAEAMMIVGKQGEGNGSRGRNGFILRGGDEGA